MRKTTKKTLTLAKEKIRKLETGELQLVHGGDLSAHCAGTYSCPN